MNAQNLVKEYYEWLQKNTEVSSDVKSEWSVITTPFVGVFNDLIEIFIKIKDEKVFLSDDGCTISNLNEIGVDISRSRNRKKIFDNILANFGIKEVEGELQVECSVENFPQKKHSFLEALIGLNDMFVLSKPNVSSVFKDDVDEYLEKIGIIYTKDFKFTGISGIDFTFDFLISERKNEKIIRAINQINKTTLTTFLYAWGDVSEKRRKVSKKNISAFAIINDGNKSIQKEFLEAIRIEKADYILWSEKDSEENQYKLKEAA
ncbi:DUF1828 domain-containing protein [Desulfobulbus sp. F1]|nr:DUF1828 domain-containing protein [Desulfobulbus sp. F1]